VLLWSVKKVGFQWRLKTQTEKNISITPNGNGIDDHTLGVELQMLLIPGADTSNAYHQESHDLTAKHVTVLIDIHEFEPVMDVNEYSTPKVQNFRVYGIFKELNYQREVDESTEYLI
jgi:hypothetical protein